ncbi:MAG: iron-containing redox enzyme family protein [Solirubrobacteraceae bacterium]|nr:iron-containing redox enzyme family protein [Solirubrobacteraceae bacterium]
MPTDLLAPDRPFDEVIADALATPALADLLAEDASRGARLLESARSLAARAFGDEDPVALDTAHRTLYVMGAQAGWSPVDAVRDNEHDLTLTAVRLELERAFEAHLARLAPLPETPPADPADAGSWLSELALERPLFAGPSMGVFYREEATLEQLREVVAQRSLFFLKEPDPWTMVIPSLRGKAKAGLIDLILDEYGWGRHDQMHSTVYGTLMEKLGLSSEYDHYFDRTSWQLLAGLNYQTMVARHRRLCRRMYGYVYLVEADSPGSMRNYLAAYARAGIDDPDVLTFYELHIDADQGHADVALNEVILPVLAEEPSAVEEIARGVVEGRYLHSLFSAHLHACFSAGRSSLREPQ